MRRLAEGLAMALAVLACAFLLAGIVVIAVGTYSYTDVSSIVDCLWLCAGMAAVFAILCHGFGADDEDDDAKGW